MICLISNGLVNLKKVSRKQISIGILIYLLDADFKSKSKLTAGIWFLLMSYLSLWDMLSLRLVSKQTFLVVNKYSRFKKYLSFSKQIISTNLWNDFVN